MHLRSDPDPAGRLCISHAEFVDAYAALAFANCEGYIVDAALDVTWSLHGIVDEPAVERVHMALLTAMTDWLTTRGLPAFFIWSIERGDTYGLHSHITLHLPPSEDATFRVFLNAEIGRLVGGGPIETAECHTYLLQTFASETTMHQWRRFKYLLKALDPAIDLSGGQTDEVTRSLAHIARMNLALGGRLHMARVGVASALSKSVRERWSARDVLPVLAIDATYPPRFDDHFLEWYEAHVDHLGLRGPGPRLSIATPVSTPSRAGGRPSSVTPV